MTEQKKDTGFVESPIIVALDYADRQQALDLVDQLSPELCRLKVGKEMFTRFGPGFVEALRVRGFQVFLDLKFHDIPNTAAQAVDAAADLGVWMVNVHASGGRRMMQACREKLAQRTDTVPLLIAVTVLTSMGETDLHEIGIERAPAQQVLQLALLAQESGMDGVVCSAQEAQALRQQSGAGFLLVTPGIRPSFAAANDQRRIMTPSEAMAVGSDYLVIGRPVTQASDPMDALQRICQELGIGE